MVLHSLWAEFCQVIYVHWKIVFVFRKALVVGLLRVRAHLWPDIRLQPTSLSINDLVGLLLTETHCKLLPFLQRVDIGSYGDDVSAEFRNSRK